MLKDSSINKAVAIWLFSCCGMVFLMVFLGGITRLTESGLSIVEWKPVTGVLPPFTHAAWLELFSDYQKSPEYRHINFGMTLWQFQNIFWLEFLHRLFGRIAGLCFLLPFLYFLWRRYFSLSMVMQLVAIFFLGFIQGLIGWYMVKSGLQEQPYVSQYWLAFHLVMACVIFSFLLLLGFSLCFSRAPYTYIHVSKPALLYSFGITSVLFLQITLGAFVAGLDGGLIYNDFPYMAGKWVPEGIFSLTPWYSNFFTNVATIQFSHRLVAYVFAGMVGVFWFAMQRKLLTKALQNTIHALFVCVLLQVGLGILTLLYHVPVYLASLHQMGAMVLLALCLSINFHFLRAYQYYRKAATH